MGFAEPSFCPTILFEVTPMRQMLLTVAFLAAAGFAFATPRQASAHFFGGYYTPSYYSYGYYTPSYYTPYYSGGSYPSYYATPYVGSYYTPGYGVYPASSYYQTYSFGPYYYPRYDRSFAVYAPGGYFYH
jgi:hypothetical protein